MKVCVVGAGYWGPNLIRNFLFHDAISEVFVCDIDREKLAQIQRKFPMLHTEPEYAAILDNPEIEVVAIATPVSSHYTLAKQALLSGKHVLVEKPMTTTSAQAQELIDIAKARALVLMVDHTFIYTAAVKKMHEIVSSGEIGTVTYFDSTRINLGLFQHDSNVVWDLAPHDLSIMLHLIPYRPVAVLASGIDHLGNGYEDIAYLTLFFAENLIAHIHLSWISPVKVRKTMIGGSKKMVIYDDMLTDEKLKVYDKGIEVSTKAEIAHAQVQYRIGDLCSPMLENQEALQVEIDHLIRCIREGETPRTGGEYGLWVVKILEAAEKSIKTASKMLL